MRILTLIAQILKMAESNAAHANDLSAECIQFSVDANDLEARWHQLAGSGHISSRWWREISERHSERHRHYHTLSHLAELFSFLDSPYGAEIAPSRRPLVEYAIFFHDIIYDPRSRTNEEDSAKLFRQYAAEAALPTEASQTVR